MRGGTQVSIVRARGIESIPYLSMFRINVFMSICVSLCDILSFMIFLELHLRIKLTIKFDNFMGLEVKTNRIILKFFMMTLKLQTPSCFYVGRVSKI